MGAELLLSEDMPPAPYSIPFATTAGLGRRVSFRYLGGAIHNELRANTTRPDLRSPRAATDKRLAPRQLAPSPRAASPG